MTQEEINSRLEAIGRPALALADVLVRSRVAAVRADQAEWDSAHPALAAERTLLLRMGEVLDAAAYQAQTAAAEDRRCAGVLRRIAGDRVADALAKAEPLPPLLSAQEWWRTESWCLALIGDLGVGKSVGAGWCALEAVKAPSRVVWVDARVSALSPLFGVQAGNQAASAREAKLLVLDDFGAEGATQAWSSWIESVLSYRHARNARTVITSNAGTEKFRVTIGARMADRIREGGVVRDFGGASLRKRRTA